MADFNSKYTGEEVEQLLDQVANGEVGGGGETLTEADIANMGFTKNEGTITEVKMNGVSKGTSGVIDLGDVPTKDEFNDHTEMIITLDEDVANLYDEKQDTISDLEAIRENANKGATSVQTYIVPFDVNALWNGETIREVHTDELKTAINNHKLILIPIDISSPTFGYVPMSAWLEDYIYFSVLVSDDIIYGTIDLNSEEIYPSDIKIITPGLKQDTLVSGENIKTINGESILGSGNISIEGGTGEVGPQGPQGEQGPKGEDGVGIASVKQTTTSSVDGGANVVTVTLSNGATSTFNVKNGSKGSNGSNGTNGKDGTDGEDGVTFTPNVDSAGNLSWTNNGGLTNPPTVNIKGPKGDAGSGGGGGKEYVIVEPSFSPIGNEVFLTMNPNKVYVVSDMITHLSIMSFVSTTNVVDNYDIIFKADQEINLSLPGNISFVWANAALPMLEASVVYELSIQRVRFGEIDSYNAILTPFKSI